MKIAVCVKQVPDTETKIKLKADGSGIDEAGIKWILNPYDEFAIEEAIKLKEASGGSVIVFSVGPQRSIDALRTALAMGADEARLIETDQTFDGFTAAQILSSAITKEGGFNLVMTGKLSIDQNSAGFGPSLAAHLKWPHLAFVSKMSVENELVIAEREVEGGDREVFEVQLPAVFTANKGLNQPRYASLPGIMKAKKKPLSTLTLADLGFSEQMVKVKFDQFQLPAEKPPVKMLQGDVSEQVAELVKILRDQEKVL